MLVRDVMTSAVLTVGPSHTIRQVAQAMRSRHVGAAVVHDPDADGPGILTERDVLESVAGGQDPDLELASAHLTPEAVVGLPDWDLDRAAAALSDGRAGALLDRWVEVSQTLSAHPPTTR